MSTGVLWSNYFVRSFDDALLGRNLFDRDHMTEPVCRICQNNVGNQKYSVRERMFGLDEEFEYFECCKCGCLQIVSVPKDTAKYYPCDYPCFQKVYSTNPVIRFLRFHRNRQLLFNDSTLGYVLGKYYTCGEMTAIGRLTHYGLSLEPNIRILDVGCGSGNLLCRLQELGFRNLVGIDPFIRDRHKHKNIRLLCGSIRDLPMHEEFDVVIYNHSFEHIFGQLEALTKTRQVLSDQGICVIRMPIKSPYIWDLCGKNWEQIDPPRHFFLHTQDSFRILVKKSGLSLQGVTFDMTENQLEMIYKGRRKISAKGVDSSMSKVGEAITRKILRRSLASRAAYLNELRQGDQASFYLRKR